MKFRIPAAVLLLCLLTLPIAAAEPSDEQVKAGLSAMASATGEDYTIERDKLVAYGESILPLLGELSALENWTGDNWSLALAAAVVKGRIADAGTFEACGDLDGLKPETYSKFRKPVPWVGRGITRLGNAALPAIIEIIEKTLDSYTFTKPGDAGGVSVEEAAQMAAAEKKALVAAIFLAIEYFRDERAWRFLRSLLSKSGDAFIRTRAARALGSFEKKEAVADLVGILDNAAEPAELRAAAADGLGRIPAQEALGAITARLKTEADASVKKALLQALGEIAGLWKWKSKKADQSPEGKAVREAAAEALMNAFDSETDVEILKIIGSAIVKICIESTAPELEARTKSGSDEKRALAAALLKRLRLRLARQGTVGME